MKVFCANKMGKSPRRNMIFASPGFATGSVVVLHSFRHPAAEFNLPAFLRDVLQLACYTQVHQMAIEFPWTEWGVGVSEFLEAWSAEMRHQSWQVDEVIVSLPAELRREFVELQTRPPSPILGLPALEIPTMETHQGPTDTSNWVIRDRLIAGAFPGDFSGGQETMRRIMECQVTTFVCLQSSGEVERFPSYQSVAEDEKPHQKSLSFVHFPINDGSIAADEEVLRLVRDLVWRLQCTDQVLYIHCWGGHGRTGTVVAILLGTLYDITPQEALQKVEEYHQMRVARRSRSPETPSQCAQVLRLLDSEYIRRMKEQISQ